MITWARSVHQYYSHLYKINMKSIRLAHENATPEQRVPNHAPRCVMTN